MTFNSPETRAAYQFVADMFLKDRTIPRAALTWDDSGNNVAYQTGRAAFVINPPSIWYWMVDNDKTLLANSVMASVPKGPGPKGTIGNAVGSWVWQVSKASKHPDYAKDFLRYFYQPDHYRAVIEKVGGRWAPIYPDMLKQLPMFSQNPAFQDFDKLSRNGFTDGASGPPNVLAGKVYDANILTKVLQKVLVDHESVVDAVVGARSRSRTSRRQAEMPSFAASGLRRLASEMLRRVGCSENEAQVVADHLVRSNLAGHDSHGVGNLPSYIRHAREGLFVPNQTLRTVLDAGALLQFDAGRGFGARMTAEAVGQAIARARQLGACVMGMRNASHLGRVGTYAEQCAQAGMAFVAFVNVADHQPYQAPYGGREARLGTNPFCAAVPGADGPALMLDMATTTIAFNKARVAHEKRLPTPDGAIIDLAGRLTTDPAALVERHEGALTAFGLHKGSGLGILCEAMGAVLTGGQRADEPARGGVLNSMLAIVIDAAAMDSEGGLAAGFAAVGMHAKSSRPAAAFEEVLLPGEPERRASAERGEHGIPMSDAGWQGIRASAEALGLSARDVDTLLA